MKTAGNAGVFLFCQSGFYISGIDVAEKHPKRNGEFWECPSAGGMPDLLCVQSGIRNALAVVIKMTMDCNIWL